MLLLWNIILLRFFRVFALTLFGFIGFLFIFQLQELARLATSGTNGLDLLIFALLQIPYILPIAIPVSCLLSATLLFIGLSRSEELTALRANGLSIAAILQPLCWMGILFSIFNFLLTSEIATRAHLKSRRLLFEITSSNPLFLIENNRISNSQGSFVFVESVKRSERAKNLILAQSVPAMRLALFLAQSISVVDKKLELEDASFLFPLNNGDLYLENIEKCEGEAHEWAALFRPQGWKLALDHLPFRLLICEIKNLKADRVKNSKRLSKSYAEIARRFSFAIAPFSFLFAGACFGIEVGREKKVLPYATLAALASLTLISFFIGKGLDYSAPLASLLFFLPHFIMITVALYRLMTLERGRHVAF